MRILSLAAVTSFVVIAACSDVAAPIATGSDTESLTDGRGAAHFLNGGHFDRGHFGDWGKHRHDGDEEQPECGGDGDGDHHGHWGKHHRYRFSSRLNHRFNAHLMGSSDEGDSEDCGGGGEETPATIGGTVTNNLTGANGFPVFLLNPQGTTVVASTTTATDGTGSYSFTDVAAGPYLVCEADPFLEIYGFLGQTRPAAGPPCPAGYAPIGFVVEVAGGDTATGNDFVNLGLE